LPTTALSFTKRLFNRSFDGDRAASFLEEAMAQELTQRSHDATEGIAAFMERRTPTTPATDPDAETFGREARRAALSIFIIAVRGSASRSPRGRAPCSRRGGPGTTPAARLPTAGHGVEGHDERDADLADHGCGHADHRRLAHVRVLGQHVLDLERVHVVPASMYISDAACEDEVAVLVEAAEVAAPQPAVGVEHFIRELLLRQ
jgi:hypothetical protein